jgi:hypothetical protein
VLLLRCAAEIAITGDYVLGPGWHTAPRLGIRRRDCDRAERVVRHVARKTGRDLERAQGLDEYLTVVLTAAILVEEGSWP